MAGRYVRPSYQYFDNSGRVLDSGKLFFYDSGTTTLKDVYSDPDGLIPIANPVILDGAGRTPDVYLVGSYKLVIQDKNGVQLQERDPVLAADDTTKGFADWNAVTTYSANDIVRASNGLLYISIVSSNQNNEPSVSAVQWTRVQLLNSYNANETYSIGDVVIDSIGDIYRSLTNSNTGNTPASSPSDWSNTVSGAFGAENILTTGTLGAGATSVTTLAASGNVTLSNAIQLESRNAADNADIHLVSLDSSNVVQIAADGNASVIGGALGVTGATTLAALTTTDSSRPAQFTVDTDGMLAVRDQITLANGVAIAVTNSADSAFRPLEFLASEYHFSTGAATFAGDVSLAGTLEAVSVSGDTLHNIKMTGAVNGENICQFDNGTYVSGSFWTTTSSGFSGTNAGLKVGSANTGRSINAAGTINASGADYAEYENNNGLTIAKGSLVGFKSDGTLTLTFSEAVRFGVKSTDPSYVGGDVWGQTKEIGERPTRPSKDLPNYDELNAQYELDFAAFEERLEDARQYVDRVAYSGKVPVNVLGATAGDYIIAAEANDGSIEGVYVADPDFAQYKLAVGRVDKIEDDGRARVAVIVH